MEAVCVDALMSGLSDKPHAVGGYVSGFGAMRVRRGAPAAIKRARRDFVGSSAYRREW
jgi:hypothetical protein